MQAFIPKDYDKAQWRSAGKDVDIFGVVEKGVFVQKFAMVKRRQDGSFDWAIAHTNFFGREQSRALAIETVNGRFLSAIELR
jgi:hypothetical protein